MHVQYYPPHSPADPARALEDNLRRAYPDLPARASDRLQEVLRRLKEKVRPEDAPLS